VKPGAERFVTIVLRGPRKPSRRKKARLKRNYLRTIRALAAHHFAIDHREAFGCDPSANSLRAFFRSFRSVERRTFLAWERA
jgi:hypothetical protein